MVNLDAQPETARHLGTPDRIRIRMRQALEQARRSAADVSASAGFSREYIGDFLLGRKTTMAVDGIARIAGVLQIDPSWLAAFDDIDTDDHGAN